MAEEHTLYDELGVVPGASNMDLNRAFCEGIIKLFEGEPEPHNSMWWGLKLPKIIRMAKAMQVLIHGEKRKEYNKTLLAKMLLCPLCEGNGTIRPHLVPCVACEGTGKAWIDPKDVSNRDSYSEEVAL